MNSIMEFLTYGLLWLGAPLALAGPSLVVKFLRRWRIRWAFAAALTPTLAGVLLLVASGYTGWGEQRPTAGGDWSNGAVVAFLTFGVVVLGVAGLACGGVVLLVSRLWRRRRSPGVA